MSKREFKSGIFSMLQEEPKYALDVYNALNGTNYTNPDLITIQKLDEQILLTVRNDASFLIDSFFNLYEHQSTFNPNLPLRFSIYFADLMKRFVREQGYNLYGSRRILVPTPRFVVFYNGLEERPAKEVFRLSDSYEHKCGDYEMDVVCTVYNINPGYNDDILKKSEVLNGYTTFVEKVRKYEKIMGKLEDALNQAVDECIAEGVLSDFFTRRRKDVLEEGYLDFTFERQLEMVARDSREDGIELGLEQGGLKKTISLICKKYQKGVTVEETSRMLEEDEEFVKVIYSLIEDMVPNYDEKVIYERYKENRMAVV